jgi:hypothetical protein
MALHMVSLTNPIFIMLSIVDLWCLSNIMSGIVKSALYLNSVPGLVSN